MSTNSYTYADATGVRSDAERDRRRAATERYQRLQKRALRATLYGDDVTADHYAERARRVAHAESWRGNHAPIIDLLERET